jgi:cytochrome c oxidase assembly protein subunit 15
VVVALVLRMRRELVGPAGMDRAMTLLTVVVLQGGLGYLQYLTGVPALLVGLHVLGSMLVWMAALRLFLTLTQPVPVVAPPADLPVDPGRSVLPSAPG